MKNLVKQYKEIILYLVFGVLTTLVNIVTYYICTKWFGINYQVSNVISWILSVTFAFITNKIYVFESKNVKKEKAIKEAISFYTFRLLSLFIDMGVMYLMVDVASIDDMISKTMANVIVIILNYVFSKLFIFKKETE